MSFSLQQVDVASTGHDVCIKIENIGGEAPKLYGRHFDENDVLVSKVSNISVCLSSVSLSYVSLSFFC